MRSSKYSDYKYTRSRYRAYSSDIDESCVYVASTVYVIKFSELSDVLIYEPCFPCYSESRDSRKLGKMIVYAEIGSNSSLITITFTRFIHTDYY